jgi:hypothetical protein
MPNVRKNRMVHIEYDLNDDVIDFWHKDLQ